MRGPETLTKYEAEKLVQSACAAMSAELARLRAALAEAERDEARKIADTWRGIANINEILLASANHDDERSRRTIRALVVAARSMWWALRHMGGHQQYFITMVRSNCAYFNRLGVTSEVDIRDRFSEKPEA